MAEEEVNYASVVFKSKNHPPTQARKEEETVYAEVKVQSETNEPTADTNAGVLLVKKANNRRLQYQQLACCLGILCVILLLGIIAVIVLYHLATVSYRHDESGLMAANLNLTNLNNNISIDIENLRTNLTAVNQNLNADVQNLTADVQNLTTKNLQLETQRKNFTKRIQDMEKNLYELNVSRAQWSIDAYCPTKTTNGWLPTGSNCYAYNNADSANQKTWEEAQQDCRGKGSDLVVVHNEEEKNALNTYSWGSSGYWFGLRAEGGRWKWIDGSNLTVSYWTPQLPPPPTDGQCVMSVQTNKWISVSCTEKKQWICIMKALSV